MLEPGTAAIERPSNEPISAARAPTLQRFGDLLQRNQGAIAVVQWTMVGVYVLLVVLPPLLPAGSPAGAALARFAEVLLWGVWWPGVVLSMLLVGQFWCGLLCPDGTLTEAASRVGLKAKIPDWITWPAWPLVLFVGITLYDHLIDAHRSPRSALAVLGGSTLLAVAAGALLGNGKRAWCRYLCPVGSVFSLLSRCAVLHFRVDRAVWDSTPRRSARAVDCPPLLDVRRLASNEKCNMCGRCSGHRGAVALAARPPAHEIATLADDEVRTWEALGIAFVLIGLLHSVASWRGSWWHALAFGALRGQALDEVAPWWVAGSSTGSMTWGEGLALLLALAGATVALGGGLWSALWLGASGDVRAASRLAYGLIPLGGLAVLLTSLEHASGLLGWSVAVPWLRAAILPPALVWSATLGWRLASSSPGRGKQAFQAAGFGAAAALVTASYALAPISGHG